MAKEGIGLGYHNADQLVDQINIGQTRHGSSCADNLPVSNCNGPAYMKHLAFCTVPFLVIRSSFADPTTHRAALIPSSRFSHQPMDRESFAHVQRINWDLLRCLDGI